MGGSDRGGRWKTSRLILVIVLRTISDVPKEIGGASCGRGVDNLAADSGDGFFYNK